MIYEENCTLPKEYKEQLSAEGMEALPDLVRVLINEAMRIERAKYIHAQPYERKEERNGHSNGFKPKTVKTRMGEITFDIPQVREGGFYPGALEKGLGSERALTLALAEMYVQGVSTRKVAAITERLCGSEVSASQVSRAAERLDELLENWRQRRLEEVLYLYLDARYEKVRQAGKV
jgi:putative transposase